MPSLCLPPGAPGSLGPVEMETRRIHEVVQITEVERRRGQRAEPLGDLDTFQVTREGLHHSSEHNDGLLSSGAKPRGLISAQCPNPSVAPTHNPKPDFPPLAPLGTPGSALSLPRLIRAAWAGVEGPGGVLSVLQPAPGSDLCLQTRCHQGPFVPTRAH